MLLSQAMYESFFMIDRRLTPRTLETSPSRINYALGV